MLRADDDDVRAGGASPASDRVDSEALNVLAATLTNMQRCVVGTLERCADTSEAIAHFLPARRANRAVRRRKRREEGARLVGWMTNADEDASERKKGDAPRVAAAVQSTRADGGSACGGDAPSRGGVMYASGVSQSGQSGAPGARVGRADGKTKPCQAPIDEISSYSAPASSRLHVCRFSPIAGACATCDGWWCASHQL